MKKPYINLTKACLAGIAIMACAPFAMARDHVNWSVNIGAGGYPPPVVYSPPPVVYAPPPVVYAPPPPVVYRPVVPYGSGVFVYSEPYRRDYEWRRHHHHHDYYRR